MGQPLSMDLRTRLLSAIDGGMSCRSAAVPFGVAPSTAIRWQARRRMTGNFAPKPQGGDTRSRRIEERREEVFAIWGPARTSRLMNFAYRWPGPAWLWRTRPSIACSCATA